MKITNNTIKQYIMQNGLPREYYHTYKMSGLSLLDFINLNRLVLTHKIAYENFKEKQEQEQLEAEITKTVEKAIENALNELE